MLFCHGVQRCRLPVLREIRQPLGTSVEAPSFLWTGDYYALTFKLELYAYLDYYNNRRIKAKLKGLPPAIHRQQALSAA